MRKHGWMLLLLVVLVGLLLVYSVTYTVGAKQIGIVSTFGKAGEPVRGSDPEQAGLKFKLPWPIQKLQRYDARIQIFDDTATELQTKDKQQVLVTIFCGWRIGDAAKFYQSVGAMAKAETILRNMVRGRKGDVIGGTPLSALLNTDPRKMRIAQIEKDIRDFVQAQASTEYGIEIVTLGIKSLGLTPGDVTKAVIESMQSERKQFAEAERDKGKAHATLITARAKAASDQILAFANARAKSIRSEGDRAVAAMYARYKRNPGLPIFLAQLEFIRKVLPNANVTLDTVGQDALKMLNEVPSQPKPDSAGTVDAKTN